MSDISIKLGDRIESDGHHATVRFIGHLPLAEKSPAAGGRPWIGVEWDDPNRGKHDGSFKGVKYFETAHSTSGSFLRLEKCNLGVSYMTALSNRYGLCTDSSSPTDKNSMFVYGRNQQTVVMAVGLDQVSQQQSQFAELRAVSVRELCVSHVGNTDEVATNSKNLVELDLSLNLFSCWKEVAAIAMCMPKLKSLNLSENRLLPPDMEDDQLYRAFTTVQSLFVNRMAYNWTSLLHCLQTFPVLENLHACYNQVELVTDVLDLPCSNSLRLINLEGNPIDSWEKIVTLGNLTCLETLVVNNCQLTKIQFPGNWSDKTDTFPALQSLSICNNQIDALSSFNELNRLRSLTSLRFTGNPVPLQSNAALTVRQLALAKISRLQYCNGAVVTRIERRDAELSYMLSNGAQWKAAKASDSENEKFTEAHPRYQELIQLYGAPEDSEIAPPRTSALKNDLISVRIETKSTDRPPLVKQLPAKMTVQRLKNLVQRAFGVIDVSAMRLTCISVQKVELDNDLRELSFYSITDGDILLAEW